MNLKPFVSFTTGFLLFFSLAITACQDSKPQEKQESEPLKQEIISIELNTENVEKEIAEIDSLAEEIDSILTNLEND